MNDKRFSFIATCGATRHELHSAYDGCRCTPFEFCSGSLNVATPHSDIELQAARRHFFGGIATNCLNNSKSAPLSPSSSPLRTASSSPPIAVYYLAKARDRCCRGVQIRQADFGSHANDLTAHRSHIPLGERGRSRKNDWAVGGLYRR